MVDKAAFSIFSRRSLTGARMQPTQPPIKAFPMKKICFMVLLLFGWQWTWAQDAAPTAGTLDSVAIPGSEVVIDLAYIPAGSVTMQVGEVEKAISILRPLPIKHLESLSTVRKA